MKGVHRSWSNNRISQQNSDAQGTEKERKHTLEHGHNYDQWPTMVIDTKLKHDTAAFPENEGDRVIKGQKLAPINESNLEKPMLNKELSQVSESMDTEQYDRQKVLKEEDKKKKEEREKIVQTPGGPMQVRPGIALKVVQDHVNVETGKKNNKDNVLLTGTNPLIQNSSAASRHLGPPPNEDDLISQNQNRHKSSKNAKSKINSPKEGI